MAMDPFILFWSTESDPDKIGRGPVYLIDHFLLRGVGQNTVGVSVPMETADKIRGRKTRAQLTAAFLRTA